MNFTPRPDLPIDLAGLAQAMVALASEIADDIVLWGCPASYVRDVIVPTVRDARSAAGKDADSFATVAALAFLRGIGRRRVRIWAIWVGSNFPAAMGWRRSGVRFRRPGGRRHRR